MSWLRYPARARPWVGTAGGAVEQRTFTGALTPSSAETLEAQTVHSGTLAPAGAVSFAVSHALAGAITPTGVLCLPSRRSPLTGRRLWLVEVSVYQCKSHPIQGDGSQMKGWSGGEGCFDTI